MTHAFSSLIFIGDVLFTFTEMLLCMKDTFTTSPLAAPLQEICSLVSRSKHQYLQRFSIEHIY